MKSVVGKDTSLTMITCNHNNKKVEEKEVNNTNAKTEQGLFKRKKIPPLKKNEVDEPKLEIKEEKEEKVERKPKNETPCKFGLKCRRPVGRCMFLHAEKQGFAKLELTQELMDSMTEYIGLIKDGDDYPAQVSFIGNYTVAAQHTVKDFQDSLEIVYRTKGQLQTATVKLLKTIVAHDCNNSREDLYLYSKPKNVKGMIPRLITSGAECAVLYYTKKDDDLVLAGEVATFKNGGYSCSTFAGSCNGPCVFQVQTQIFVGGIHNATDGESNFSILFTKSMLSNFS